MVLADILTVAGVAGSAALVTGFVELMKKTFPVVGEKHLEQPLALLVSLILVVLALVSVVTTGGVLTLELVFTGFVAWLSIAKLSTGIHDELTGAEGAFTHKDEV